MSAARAFALHLVFAGGRCGLSGALEEIKRLFTKGYLARVGPGEERNESRVKKGEAAIWQRRYWEHMIRDEEDLGRHIDYIHYNPVKHGLVERVADWRWSRLHV